MKELLYKYQGRWFYADRKDDPEAVQTLQDFLGKATPDSSAEVEIEIAPIGIAVEVRCNGMSSIDRDLLEDLNAVDSSLFVDAAFCG